MQIIPRYLVSNRITIVANEAGFVTEYKPVYQRNVQVYRGIDNVVEFKLLNADQKPINLSSYTIKFIAFDENKNLVIEHDGVQVTSDGSTPITGVFKVTITENDLLNIKQQYLSYNIYLVDANDNKVLTYTDSHFGNDGTIYVGGETFPGPKESYSITTFTETAVNSGVFVSESVDAQPGINGNDALHTAAVYTDGYSGTLTIEATLDNQVTGTTAWATVDTLTLTGTETEPTPVNFNGVYSHLRVKADNDPSSTITKILLRN